MNISVFDALFMDSDDAVNFKLTMKKIFYEV